MDANLRLVKQKFLKLFVVSVYLYFRNVLYGLRDCGGGLQLPVSSLNQKNAFAATTISIVSFPYSQDCRRGKFLSL